MGRHIGTKRMDSLCNGYMLFGDTIMTKRYEVQLQHGSTSVNKTYEHQTGVDDWKDALELAITELLEMSDKDVDINYIKEYQ
tara:strand:+ start:857 stop:1102 length:246 start_codon:yes stop_codon:yes gene_type:complete